MTPINWKRICVAVDFSDSSRRALDQAAELARAAGAELHVLHVHARPAASAVDLLGAGFEPFEDEEWIRARLADWQRLAAERLDRPVRAVMELGAAAPRIAEYAGRAGIDLLVLATHGRSGLPRVLMGSVAERVVRLAPCPVLVVRGRPATHATSEDEAPAAPPPA